MIMMEKINLDDIYDINFNTYDDHDKLDQYISKMKGKPTIKGTSLEKSVRIGLKFTKPQKAEIEKFRSTLGATTFNGILYKLIN